MRSPALASDGRTCDGAVRDAVARYGDTLDKAHAVSLGSGGYAVAPANMHHYAWTKSGATIQVHMMGPFAITYVNPADDPTHAAAK
jgi:hypothetical protein